jgi:hypothetical protein
MRFGLRAAMTVPLTPRRRNAGFTRRIKSAVGTSCSSFIRPSLLLKMWRSADTDHPNAVTVRENLAAVEAAHNLGT